MLRRAPMIMFIATVVLLLGSWRLLIFETDKYYSHPKVEYASPVGPGPEEAKLQAELELERQKIKIYGLYMPIVVSILVLASALWMILSKRYDANALKWAYGTVGTIIGYWMKVQ
jgi:hypothetical protein